MVATTLNPPFGGSGGGREGKSKGVKLRCAGQSLQSRLKMLRHAGSSASKAMLDVGAYQSIGSTLTYYPGEYPKTSIGYWLFAFPIQVRHMLLTHTSSDY